MSTAPRAHRRSSHSGRRGRETDAPPPTVTIRFRRRGPVAAPLPRRRSRPASPVATTELPWRIALPPKATPWARSGILTLLLFGLRTPTGFAHGAPRPDHGASPLTHYSVVAIHPHSDAAESGEVQYSSSTADGVVFRGRDPGVALNVRIRRLPKPDFRNSPFS